MRFQVLLGSNIRMRLSLINQPDVGCVRFCRPYDEPIIDNYFVDSRTLTLLTEYVCLSMGVGQCKAPRIE